MPGSEDFAGPTRGLARGPGSLRLTMPLRDWPKGWRWLLAIPVTIAHWLAFKSVTEVYIETFVTPRTGFYFSDNFRGLELIAPPASLLLLLAALILHLFMSLRILLGLWIALGLATTAFVAMNEIAAGREFWPDVICVAWAFAFHAMLVMAMTARMHRHTQHA